MPLLPDDIPEGSGLHRCEDRGGLVEDSEEMFISVLSPMIILRSEKHWGHVLQLCSLPIWYDCNYWQFYLHRYMAQVKLSVLIRYLGRKEPQEDSEGLGHLHWLLMFWVMFPKGGHFQETRVWCFFQTLASFKDWEVETIYCKWVSTQRKGNIITTSVNKFWKKVERE